MMNCCSGTGEYFLFGVGSLTGNLSNNNSFSFPQRCFSFPFCCQSLQPMMMAAFGCSGRKLFLPPPCRSRSPNECNLQGKRLIFLFVRSLCYPTLIPRIRSAVTKIPFFPSFLLFPLSHPLLLWGSQTTYTHNTRWNSRPALQLFFFLSSVAYCPLSPFVMKENDLLLLTHKHE